MMRPPVRLTLADAPDVLTVPEAARLLRVGRNQMYQAIERGDIYAARIGRSLRVPKASLERWLHSLDGAAAPRVPDFRARAGR